MSADVFLLSLRLQRTAILGWAAAVAAIGWLTMAFYPYIGPEYEEVFSSLPEGWAEAFGLEGMDLSRPEGFLAAEYLSYVPLLLGIFAILQSSREVAGEAERGSLDFLLAQPVRRSTVLAQKAAALCVAMLALCLAVPVGLVAGAATAGVAVSYANLALLGLDLVPFGLLFTALGLVGSAAAAHRGRAAAPATAYLVAAYVLGLLAPLAPQLERLKWVSAFSLFQRSHALLRDVDALYWAVCLGAAAALYAASAFLFQRRDVR